MKWSTTYNCPEWDRNINGVDCNCDGLQRYLDHPCTTTTPNLYEQITLAANNPIGGGVRGQRHWLGDGKNYGSGGTYITLTNVFGAPQNEIWMRWYMRFEQGFAWMGGTIGPYGFKSIYIDPLSALRIMLDFYYDQLRFYCYNSQTQYRSAHGTGFGYINNGTTGDGKFHCYEVHIKIDTNHTDGIAEWWVDGTKIIDVHTADFGTTSINQIVIGSNADSPSNGRCAYVDYDDVVISTEGYIGPIGTPTCPPVVCDLQLTII